MTTSKRLQPGDVIEVEIQGLPYRYVVEDARKTGGGYGHGPHDYYPDGWRVTARELDIDNQYNPKGRTIEFYQKGQGGCFDMQDYPVVGKMTKQWVW